MTTLTEKIASRLARAVRRSAGAVGWYPAWRIRRGPGKGLRISARNSSADYPAGINEVAVQEAMQEHLRPGDVFYDIGANVGFFGIIAARLVGESGTVICFEPVPGNARSIEANARSNHLSNLSVIAIAASDRPGPSTLALSEHPGGAVLSATGAPPDETGLLEVEAARIDDLVAEGRIPFPDVVKIDVEGAEPEVLSGMRSTLQEHRPVVICELDDSSSSLLEAKLEGVLVGLNRLGYAVSLLQDSYPGTGWEVVHLVAVPDEGVAQARRAG